MKIIFFFGLFLLLNITQSHANFYYLDFSDINLSDSLSSKPSLKVQTSIKEKIERCEEELDTVQILSFRRDHMTSDVFNFITDSILPSFQKKQDNPLSLTILDLSHNMLDENVAETLKKWLKVIPRLYIDVTDNPVDVKNVSKLYNKFVLTADSEISEVDRFMRQIIFIKKNYLSAARNKVAVYKMLVNQKIIPNDWANIHDRYYNLTIKKDFETFKQHQSYVECMEKMKRLTIGITTLESEDAQKEQGEIDFKTALKVITPPTTPAFIIPFK